MEYDVIVIDGYCNICNKFCQFIVKYDIKNKYKISDFDSLFSKQNNLELKKINSIVLVKKDKSILKNSKALKSIFYNIPKLKAIYYILKITPEFISDFAYKTIANNRYSLFGKRESCSISSKKNNKFIN
jgi:predicted DCC family thiol-disulfide oxidoreductase YuxK